MSFTLLISPLALAEINNAYIYYENQSPELGKRFLKLLEESYQKLASSPNYYSYLNQKKDLRSISIKKFPFIIIFQITKDKVLVLSVFNTNRDPRIIKKL
jgi:plasmid stabilization system protein ParE